MRLDSTQCKGDAKVGTCSLVPAHLCRSNRATFENAKRNTTDRPIQKFDQLVDLEQFEAACGMKPCGNWPAGTWDGFWAIALHIVSWVYIIPSAQLRAIIGTTCPNFGIAPMPA